jgi:hypothetical protein
MQASRSAARQSARRVRATLPGCGPAAAPAAPKRAAEPDPPILPEPPAQRFPPAKPNPAADALADGFADTLHLCEQAFRLHHPDARAMATRLRDRHRNLAETLAARGADSRADVHGRMAAALDGVLRQNRRKTLYRDDRLADPAPHRAPKPWQEDPVERLFADERIDAGEKAAAERIAAIYRGLWTVRLTTSLETAGMGSAGGGAGYGIERMPERLARWYLDSYRPWVRWMAAGQVAWCGGCWKVYPPVLNDCPLCSVKGSRKRLSRAPANLPLVLDVAVDGMSLKTARERHGVSWNKALMLLKGGLRAYARAGERD